MSEMIVEIDTSNVKKLPFTKSGTEPLFIKDAKCPHCGADIEIKLRYYYGLAIYAFCDECCEDVEIDQSSVKIKTQIVIEGIETLKAIP